MHERGQQVVLLKHSLSLGQLGTQGRVLLLQSVKPLAVIAALLGFLVAHRRLFVKQLSGGISDLVAKLSEASDAIEELSEGQRAVVRSVQSVGPEVLGAVTQMRSQMEGTSQAVAHSMQQVQGAMGRTSEDLNGVVTSIKDGVTEYSRQLAALHLDMDTAMAKAVGKLGGAIQDLNESIEDLNDGLEAFREKT